MFAMMLGMLSSNRTNEIPLNLHANHVWTASLSVGQRSPTISNNTTICLLMRFGVNVLQGHHPHRIRHKSIYKSIENVSNSAG